MKPDAQPNLPEGFLFPDNGDIPNNPNLPLLLYRAALDAESGDLATEFEKRFAANGWSDSWRDGVYPYHHYHSVTHEALGIYRGYATLELGGPAGERFAVNAGDLIVVPAGVAHRRVEASDDFGVVGAYPIGSDFNLMREGVEDRAKVDHEIAQTPLPDRDPLFGAKGPLRQMWRDRGDI